MPPRLFIDCSETYKINLISGIQRVVRNIIERRELITKELGVEVIPVVFDKDRYIRLDEFLKTKSKVNLKEISKGIIKSKIKDERIYSILKSIYLKAKLIRSYFLYFRKNIIPKEEGLFKSSDILLMIDIYWNPEYECFCYKNIISELKRNKVKIINLVYDVLALENPNYVMKYFFKQLYNSFYYMLSYTDCILTISKSEKIRIENYLRSINVEKEVDYFYLGSDFASKKIDENKLKELEKFTPYFLMVGTIEPRKGYDVAFDAFEKLWEKGFDKNLVIVGKVGWMVDELIAKMKNSKFYDKKLFILNSVPDDFLQGFYIKSKAVICASRREGFGLPVIEAMHYKKPLITTDIDVFREIGGDYPVYFKCGDSDDLIRAILDLENYSFDYKEKSFKPLTWDESVLMMCERIKKWI
ncbi:MAG: glycosyltransferase family 4 protein [Thermodesulfobium sp.]